MMNCIPCVTWIAKGKAERNPHKLQLSPEELKSLVEESQELLEKSSSEKSDAEQDEEDISSDESNKIKNDVSPSNGHQSTEDLDIVAKYGLDKYDDEEEETPFNLANVAVHIDNKDDEYMVNSDGADELEELEDFIIKDNDNILVVGHVEDDSSVLEIHIYNKDEGAFYVHHDIVLPAYPLALEWLDFHASDDSPGNYIAVGDMTPIIKVWDLDVVDILEPEYELGKKRKKKSPNKQDIKGHNDAVLSLSWNKHVRNILASGSADCTVILWDLSTAKIAKKLHFHSNKVQALQWHPCESPFLLSGCTDGFVNLYDCRSDEAVVKSWKVDGEIEKIAWNLSDSFKFFCSTDTGYVHSMDMRCDEITSFQAHKKAVTGLDMSPLHPNILITASMDETIKAWNLENELIKSWKSKIGSIYAAQVAPDLDLTVALGGNNESYNLKVLDIALKIKDSKKAEVFERNIVQKESQNTVKSEEMFDRTAIKEENSERNDTNDFTNIVAPLAKKMKKESYK